MTPSLPARARPIRPRPPGRFRRLAGVVLAATLAACGAGERAPEPLHGIVLIGLDTLRADGLSSYGNPRPTSPHIDALAAEGVLFENAVSNASWTLPGFIAILSGQQPSARVFRGRLLASGVERLRDAGYRTAAFTEGGFVSHQFGMDLGFETFWEETAPVIQAPAPDVGVAKTFGKAIDWLRSNGREPFFLFVHSYEAHVPYQRMRFTKGLDPGRLGGVYDRAQNNRVLNEQIPVTDRERAWVRALYDGGVAEADQAVGRLVAVLGELGVADRTLIVVTSDHGEQLGEHLPRQLGLHGQTLWDTILRVPLVVRDPRRGDRGRRVATQVRTVDVMPTILALAGLDPDPGDPASADGASLVPILDGAETSDREAFSELRARDTGRLRAATLRTSAHKLHLNAPGSDRPALELYDLVTDPGETRDRALEAGRERERLHAELQNRVAEIERRGPPWGGRTSVTPALKRRLEALGYLGRE